MLVLQGVLSHAAGAWSSTEGGYSRQQQLTHYSGLTALFPTLSLVYNPLHIQEVPVKCLL